MGISRVTTVRRDGARPRDLAAPHSGHAVAPYGVEYDVVLFILTVSSQGLLTAYVAT